MSALIPIDLTIDALLGAVHPDGEPTNKGTGDGRGKVRDYAK